MAPIGCSNKANAECPPRTNSRPSPKRHRIKEKRARAAAFQPENQGYGFEKDKPATRKAPRVSPALRRRSNDSLSNPSPLVKTTLVWGIWFLAFSHGHADLRVHVAGCWSPHPFVLETLATSVCPHPDKRAFCWVYRPCELRCASSRASVFGCGVSRGFIAGHQLEVSWF